MSTFASCILDGTVLVFRNSISVYQISCNFNKKIDHAHLRTIDATSFFEGGGKLGLRANNFCWNRQRLFRARISRSRIFFLTADRGSLLYTLPPAATPLQPHVDDLTLLVSLALPAKCFSSGHNGRILAALHGENISAGKKS